MNTSVALAFSFLFLGGCTSSSSPSDSGGAGGTGGIGAHGGGGSGGATACPGDFIAADGTPCAPEGRVCSDGGTDICQFGNSVTCTNGKWVWQEAFPAPCGGAGGGGGALGTAGGGGALAGNGGSGG
jgi:hypothetical protein